MHRRVIDGQPFRGGSGVEFLVFANEGQGRQAGGLPVSRWSSRVTASCTAS